MHRIVWPHIGEMIGVNIGVDPKISFVAARLTSADERLFTVELDGASLHYGMQWVVGTAEGQFEVDDQDVTLLIELHRPDAGSNHTLIEALPRTAKSS